VNWRSPHFAEVYVYTQTQARGRGWGRSVLSSLCAALLQDGLMPLYVVSEQNSTSINLAESVGFVDSGMREFAAQVVRQEK
jgi:L-amino acid N-acyltransferase YncA